MSFLLFFTSGTHNRSYLASTSRRDPSRPILYGLPRPMFFNSGPLSRPTHTLFGVATQSCKLPIADSSVRRGWRQATGSTGTLLRSSLKFSRKRSLNSSIDEYGNQLPLHRNNSWPSALAYVKQFSASGIFLLSFGRSS